MGEPFPLKFSKWKSEPSTETKIPSSGRAAFSNRRQNNKLPLVLENFDDIIAVIINGVIEILEQGNKSNLNQFPDKQATVTAFRCIRPPCINSVARVFHKNSAINHSDLNRGINCCSAEAESQSGGAYRTITERRESHAVAENTTTNLNPMRPCALNIATTGCMAMRRITRNSLLLFKSAGPHPSTGESALSARQANRQGDKIKCY